MSQRSSLRDIQLYHIRCWYMDSLLSPRWSIVLYGVSCWSSWDSRIPTPQLSSPDACKNTCNRSQIAKCLLSLNLQEIKLVIISQMNMPPCTSSNWKIISRAISAPWSREWRKELLALIIVNCFLLRSSTLMIIFSFRLGYIGQRYDIIKRVESWRGDFDLVWAEVRADEVHF